METLLLDCSLRAALMAVGTAAVLGALRICSPSAQHIAWTGVLLAMLLLPAWALWGPKLSAPVLPAVRNQRAADASSQEVMPLRPAAPYVEAKGNSEGPSARLAKVSRLTWNWWWLALAGYFLGFGALIIRLAAGAIRARAMVRRATPVDGVLVSAECAAPVTVGWFRPMVILPQGWQSWPAAKLDAVLTHEGEHVRRRDPLVQGLALLNRSIFWFHPLAWWLERKLADLAEDACDAAVLRRGHAPADYSQYLIELARSVTGAGARIGIMGTAIGGGALSSRVRRILDGRPLSPLSRPRSVVATALCLVILAVFVACKLERASKPVAGQPSMNELMHRKAAERQAGEQKRQALLDEVQKLTPDQAQALEAELKTNPQDREKILTLVRYYQHKVDVQGLVALTLWYIEHEPAMSWAWNIHPEWDRAGYERGKKLWLAQLKKPGASVAIYRNALAFLEGGDKPLAEEVLLAGQKAYPNEDWVMELGRHYAQALLGSVGPVAEYNVLRSLSMEEAHGTYAQSVRNKLASSDDPKLLRQTAQYLMSWGTRFLYRKENPLDFDVLALARSYNERSLSLQPDNQAALSLKLQLQEAETALRLRNTPPEQLSQAERLRLLRQQMETAFWSKKMDEVESKARELLSLAAQNKDDDEYGNAIFYANLSLGDVALRRGEKRQAARYLLAASEAPPTDHLRNGYIDMTLARQLVDWGEREAVAQFLERCAGFNRRGKDLAGWAAQLRQGINPDLTPYKT
jgi:hypothetical protein